MRMQAVALLLMMAVATETEAAFADRATLPAEQQAYAYYLTTSTVADEHRETLARVLRFVVPSLSRESYLADQLPVAVSGTYLLRIDTQALGWHKHYATILRTHYPYRPEITSQGGHPLVVDGLWFAANVIDPTRTGDAQYRLLYDTPPKTDKEFRKFWQVNERRDLFFGLIEGESGVANERTRVLENHPTANRSYHWQTYDSEIVAGKTDPLESLAKLPPQYDASELIAGIPKHYAGKSGTLQAYFLADGKGSRQEKAPASIVTDHTGTRGVEIVNTLSCIVCHTDGIREPTLDAYREYILSGARIFADKVTQREIDRYLQSDLAKEITRNNEDYTAGVAMCNGLTPKDNALAVKQIVQLYDAPITLEQAARELYTTPDDLRLALGDYSRLQGLSGRLALLAQGKPISRDQWVANYALAQRIIATWHAR
jgi:hypothetical protein